MKQIVFSSHAQFTQLFAISAGAWIAFAGAVQAQSNADPTTAATNAAPGNAQPATPSATQATDISQIPGAKLTKTGNVITAFAIDDSRTLTEGDYKLIRQTESLKSMSFGRGPTGAGLKILAGMPAIEGFGSNGTPLTDDDIALLATFKNLHGVTFFHPGGQFKGTGLAALAVLPNLENMTMAGSYAFGDPGMAAVGQLTHLKAFRTWHNNVTIEGIKSLVSLKELTNLMLGQRLSSKPPATISDDAIAVLANIPSLENLNVSEARLSLPALSKLSQLPNLKVLTLDGIDIPESDIATLKQQLPKTDIRFTPATPASLKWINNIFGPPVTAIAPGTTPPTSELK